MPNRTTACGQALAALSLTFAQTPSLASEPRSVRPGAGVLCALLINPVASDTALAGDLYGGLFQTTDAGKTWRAVVDGLGGDTFVRALAVDPSVPTTVYLATLTRLFRSADSGKTWRPITAPPDQSDMVIVMGGGSPSALYAGTVYGGVFKTTDSGETWRTINDGLLRTVINHRDAYDIRALAVDDHSKGILYAASGRTISKSVDEGAQWKAKSIGAAGPVFALAIDSNRAGTLYAGAWDGVFKSTNAGDSWKSRSDGLPEFPGVQALAIDPLHPATLYAGTKGDGVFKTTDGAEHWLPMNAGFSRCTICGIIAGRRYSFSEIFVLAVDPVRSASVYAGTYVSGVLKTTDGAKTWTSANDGITTRTDLED